MIKHSQWSWGRRGCAGCWPALPVPAIGMTVEQLAVTPRRALAALALGGAVVVLADGGLVGVLTRDRRVRRDVRLALALAAALELDGPSTRDGDEREGC